MTLRNMLRNWFYGVKRYRGKGCRNVGTMRRGQEMVYVKYDWGKPFVYRSPIKYEYKITALNDKGETVLNDKGETVMWDRWEVGQ